LQLQRLQNQAQAQQVLNAFAGDPYKLDGDKDGIACESLPYGLMTQYDLRLF
jgi:hypothetical protein